MSRCDSTSSHVRLNLRFPAPFSATSLRPGGVSPGKHEKQIDQQKNVTRHRLDSSGGARATANHKTPTSRTLEGNDGADAGPAATSRSASRGAIAGDCHPRGTANSKLWT
jgi:hypothetical protein